MRLKDLFETIALGQQICIVKALDQHPVPGECERNGAVINKVRNTRTEYLVVLFEDGHKEKQARPLTFLLLLPRLNDRRSICDPCKSRIRSQF